tara:strand:- start:18250 stop:18408 length:159 start_codon:yes stop_codon:yes gene_type:complete
VNILNSYLKIGLAGALAGARLAVVLAAVVAFGVVVVAFGVVLDVLRGICKLR